MAFTSRPSKPFSLSVCHLETTPSLSRRLTDLVYSSRHETSSSDVRCAVKRIRKSAENLSQKFIMHVKPWGQDLGMLVDRSVSTRWP